MIYAQSLLHIRGVNEPNMNIFWNFLSDDLPMRKNQDFGVHNEVTDWSSHYGYAKSIKGPNHLLRVS